MPTISSLMRSAAATRQKIQNQQDAQMAFDWENSAQTYDDYIAYSNYLEGRQQTVTDPSDALTYATKIRSARRSYTSNEIQRQQMNVMEGSSSLSDKQNTVYELYKQAVANGDYNLAQNLASQYDSLSVQIQNEQKVAYGNAVSAGKKAADKFLKNLISGDGYIELPDGSVAMSFKEITRQVNQSGGIEGGVNVWDAAQKTVDALTNGVQAALQSAPDQETYDSIYDKYAGFFDGSKPINIMGQSMTANDIYAAKQNDQFNNPLYSLKQSYDPSTGTNTYKLQKNDAQDYQWVRQGVDPTTGDDLFVPYPVQVSKRPQDITPTLDTQITNNGEIIGPDIGGGKGNINAGTGTANTNNSQSLKNRLAALGIQTSSQNGQMYITLQDGNTYQAVITPSGNVRYVGQPNSQSGGANGIYEIMLTDNGLATDKDGKVINDNGTFYYGQQAIGADRIREVAPDETSIFGTDSLFGGKLSQANREGSRVLNQFATNDPLGQLKPRDLRNANISGMAQPLLSGPLNTANNFTGSGFAATSAVLQSANFTLQAREAERQAAEASRLQAAQAAARIQPATAFNLNQTPVSQFANNGAPIRQLSVARPTPQPAIRVAAPVAPPKVTVSNQPNTLGQLGISGNYTGTLRVR